MMMLTTLIESGKSFDFTAENRFSISFGNLRFSPPLALAPMVGLSHSAFRRLLLEMGGVGLFYTEMLDAARLGEENARVAPVLIRHQSESPLIYQLFLADDRHLERAVAKLESLGAQGIDLNLGCPAPQLKRLDAGAYLAMRPQQVQQIIARLRRMTPLPVSAKIRLGREQGSTELLDFCRMLAGEGVDLLAVHARLHTEKFCRPPHWQEIARIKEVVDIPVLANGGVFSVADARSCLAQSGADGLMLGRGAVERPWLFAEIAAALYGGPLPVVWNRPALYFRYVELVQEMFPVERQLGRLKQFTSYFARSFSFGHHLAVAVQGSHSIDQAKERAAEFFAQQVSPGESASSAFS